ncbi:MAG: AAA family ATPase [Gemmataceae bacterium]
MIESIEFTNFKALRQTTLPLAPFTLLLGSNGSGKTSVLQALQRIAAIFPPPQGQAKYVGLSEGSLVWILYGGLAAYNVMSTVKSALRSVHGVEKIEKEVSGYNMADEISGTYRGMMIAIPTEKWLVFRDLSVVE